MNKIAQDAQLTVLAHFGLTKVAALDPKMLAEALSSAQLGDEPETVQFKSPSGHTVTSPYTEGTVEHHIRRSGSPEAYYQALGRALSERGTRLDKQVEHERDLDVADRRSGNTLTGGVLGGLGGAAGGALIGHLLKSPRAGAAIGGALGAIGGGVYGHGRPVERETGAISRSVDDIPELYKEPEHVRALKSNLASMEDQLADIRTSQQISSFNDALRDLRYDPYYPYYGRSRYYY